MRVVLTPFAERQLDNLHAYISTRSGEDRADVYIGRIIDYCIGIVTFPLRGTQRDDVLPGLRTLGFERSATIAFMVTVDTVLIEGIFYGGQDFESVFRGRT